jgi:UPF0755 protein
MVTRRGHGAESVRASRLRRCAEAVICRAGRPTRVIAGAASLLAVLAGCEMNGDPSLAGADPVRFTVPAGSGFSAVTDTLAARGLVNNTLAFRLYARYKQLDRAVKPGVYETQPGLAWEELLDKLVRGDVVQMTLVVPEGWMLSQIVPRLAEAAGVPADSLLEALLSEEAAERYGVDGPTLEGYIYPATYTFPLGSGIETIVRGMIGRYQQVWTEPRLALADSIGLSPREVVTLASIVEKEARVWGERDTIAAVYRNRLRIGMPLQADPTVQYARGEHETRLLYAHIDEVAEHPYNTYRRAGLPPGPIASPSTGAIDATLRPADVDFLYFVARPNGTHIFTRSLREHNNARQTVARLAAEARQAAAAAADLPGGP